MQFADKEMDRAAHVETPVVLVVQASYNVCILHETPIVGQVKFACVCVCVYMCEVCLYVCRCMCVSEKFV